LLDVSILDNPPQRQVSLDVSGHNCDTGSAYAGISADNDGILSLVRPGCVHAVLHSLLRGWQYGTFAKPGGSLICGNFDPATGAMTLEFGSQDDELPQSVGELRVLGSEVAIGD